MSLLCQFMRFYFNLKTQGVTSGPLFELLSFMTGIAAFVFLAAEVYMRHISYTLYEEFTVQYSINKFRLNDTNVNRIICRLFFRRSASIALLIRYISPT